MKSVVEWLVGIAVGSLYSETFLSLFSYREPSLVEEKLENILFAPTIRQKRKPLNYTQRHFSVKLRQIWVNQCTLRKVKTMLFGCKKLVGDQGTSREIPKSLFFIATLWSYTKKTFKIYEKAH